MFYKNSIQVFYSDKNNSDIHYTYTSDKCLKSLLNNRIKKDYIIKGFKIVKQPKINKKGNYSIFNRFLLKYTNFYK